MTSLDTQVTSRPADVPAIDRVRSILPFRSVVLPWLVARVLVVPMLVANTYGPGVTTRPGALLAMDGGWFRLIAVDWYDQHDGAGGTAEYPFFPLLPALGGVLMRVGVPSTVALAGLAWMAALAAMAGARLLALRHVGEGAGRLTPWVIALAPGGLSLILGYSDSLYLAGLIWALVALDHRRWWLAGTLAALATASRPNGVIAVIAVLAVAVGLRATRRQLVALIVPSGIFLLAWVIYLGWTTGDPLIFWTAKSQWVELTIVDFLTDPFHQRLALAHVVLLAIFVTPYVMRVRRQPPAWALVAILGVLPALVLGVVGVARYAILAFPIPIAAADLLSEQPRWVRIVALAVSAVALMIFARLVVTNSWIP